MGTERETEAAPEAGGRWRRVGALAAVEAHGVRRHLGVCALVLAFLVFGLVLPAREAGRALVLWGVGTDNYDPGGGPMRTFLRECLSWWWLFVSVVYLLPVVLLPLAGSFAPSQVLWLRLTPCSPRDVGLARAARLAVALLALSVLGLAAAAAGAWWHGLPVSSVLDVAGGLPAHVLLAGGVVMAAGPTLASPAGRALAAFVGFLAPLLLFLVYAALGARLPESVRPWWPYAVPFAPAWTQPARHVAAAAVLGAGLVVLAILRQPGRCETLSLPPVESRP